MTPPPTVPDPEDPSTFSDRMDAFIAWLATFAAELTTYVSAYQLSQVGTSTTSLTIGTGAKSLTTQTGLGFVVGQEVVVSRTASGTDRMAGTVTAYNTSTGALDVTVSTTGGSGTYTAWSISPTSIADFDGVSFTSLVLAGSVTETPYALSGTAIDAANGTIQTKTLAADTTFTSSLTDGQSVVLHITKSTWTITWPTMDWLWVDPTLSSTGVSVVVLWKVGSTLCGVYCGPLQ